MEDFEFKKTPIAKVDENRTYQMYATHTVKDVPNSEMEIMMKVFMQGASVNMGTEVTDNMIRTMLDFIYREFFYFPVYEIGSAIVKGSLGKYGPGKLVPRTVYGWLTEAAQEFYRKQDHEKAIARDSSVPLDLNKYPAGRAVILKAGWLEAGIITDEEYEKIPLKGVYERLAQGLDCVPELWGIKSRKPKNQLYAGR